MIYITDNFSLNMLTNTEHELETEEIKEKDFFKIILEEDKTYSIKSKYISEHLSIFSQTQEITLEKGDEIYAITSEFGRSHTSYHKENTLRYERIKIIY
ncbi:MAG: hypothetical protein BZ134_06490 [Methanosphaera sp. SHI1033]|jgi:hypothetical protein|uniref:hypothetical protein n=1 Tax=Candidatus Methanosphaera massiliense TaxID=3017187 RepID=UPI000DC5B2E8|nr:hypothetical protein [Candidatus Methanosphaera massiliense]MDE4078417.1 hypothetical protein [Candidatus Methanosphaera massiliense]RAP43540.1 MAG: hypothetical protein BZ134_06490 [Methanosphaera sp. SHI1033]